MSPGQDDHVLHSSSSSSGSPVRPTASASPVPDWVELLDELDLHGRGGELHQGLGHPLAPVPHDDDHPADVDLGHGVEDVEDHGAPTQEVQRLGALGAHPRPLPGGEDHGGEPAFGHRRILSPPGSPACVWDTRGVPELIPYDEFGLFHENAAEYGLPYDGPPPCAGSTSRSAPGRRGFQPALGRRARPSWCSSTGGPRTPTRGTPWRWPWAGRCWPSTCPATATPTAGPRAPSRPAATAAIWRRSWPSSHRRPAAWSGCRSAGCRPSRWPRTPPSWCAPWSWSTSPRASTRRRRRR